jgi:predicted RNase H-like nuclease (RuvC/YqgF family)
MSDTPRTDAREWDWHEDCSPVDDMIVDADFARQLERELAKAQNILKQCLSIMPVGYVPTHTVENLPEMIGDLAKALAEETTEREQLERELAEARDKIKNLHRLLENILKPDSDGQDYKEARKYLAAVKGGEA